MELLFASAIGLLTAGGLYLDGVESYTDPLPQALVLTAIVISFGMTAVVVMLALGSFLSSRDDTVNIGSETPPEQPAQENEA